MKTIDNKLRAIENELDQSYQSFMILGGPTSSATMQYLSSGPATFFRHQINRYDGIHLSCPQSHEND